MDQATLISRLLVFGVDLTTVEDSGYFEWFFSSPWTFIVINRSLVLEYDMFIFYRIALIPAYKWAHIW